MNMKRNFIKDYIQNLKKGKKKKKGTWNILRMEKKYNGLSVELAFLKCVIFFFTIQ